VDRKKLGLIILAAVAGMFPFLVELPLQSPGSTRVILDHSLQTFIAPSCFEQAEISNNLSDSTLGRARDKRYVPESACSERALAHARMTLFQLLWETTGAWTGRREW